MLKTFFIVALATISTASFAGQWQVKIGGSLLQPSAKHNTLAEGLVTDAKADNGASFTPSIEYFFEDPRFSAELLLATPFKHEVKASINGQPSAQIAEFKHLPPTLTFKYHFINSTPITPYFGAGVTAVIPFQERARGDLEGAKLRANMTYGLAGQVGVIVNPIKDNKNWGVFADVRYAKVEPDLKIDGVKIGTLNIDPWVYTAGISYRF